MAKKKTNPAANFLQGLLNDTPEAAPVEAAPAAPMAFDAVLSIDDIQPHPYNREVNIEDESAVALKESILVNGFTDKVQVVTRENAMELGVEGLTDAPYVALNCHHRLAICRKYRPDIVTVEAVIRTYQTALEMLYVIVDYNAARPLLTSERAKQIRRIKGEVARAIQPGEDTLTIIAKRLGKSRTLVYMLDAISDMEPALLKCVDSGDVILKDAMELRKLSDEAQNRLAAAISALDAGLEGDARRAAVRSLVSRARAGEGSAAPEVPAVKKPAPPRDLAKAVQATLKALPQEGEELVVPKYRKRVEPMVKGMDEAILALAKQRLKYAEHPMPDNVKTALRELLGS